MLRRKSKGKMPVSGSKKKEKEPEKSLSKVMRKKNKRMKISEPVYEEESESESDESQVEMEEEEDEVSDFESDFEEEEEEEEEDDEVHIPRKIGVIAGFGDEDEDDSDSEMEVEKAARELDEQHAEDELMEAEDIKRALIEEGRYPLPTAKELENEQKYPLEPASLKARIQGVVGALTDFKSRRDPEKQRNDYIDQLTKDLAAYYSYSIWLVEQFLKLFPASEVVELMEANETPRPVTIRANTLKARRKDVARELIARGVNLDPLSKWSAVGLQVYGSTVPIGATPEYLAGRYMLQSASSFLPVMALGAKDDEKVLDMSAAPGGKTTYISAEMRNTGIVVANDPNPARCKALAANVARLGCNNVMVTSFDGREIPDSFGVKFDRVLLDAPCTGTGVLARDPAAKLNKGLSDLQKCQFLQKELILAAIDSLDAKGSKTLVYSTCSILVEENEQVVDYALKMRPVRVVPCGVPVGVPGFTKYRGSRFHPSLNEARRVYPHVHNMDGFFYCKLEKYVPADTDAASQAVKEDKEARKEKKKGQEKKRNRMGKRERDKLRSMSDSVSASKSKTKPKPKTKSKSKK